MADTTKHTPGPWMFEDYSDDVRTVFATVGGKAVAVADALRLEDDVGALDSETQAANARLIAAAPDLLAALREALPHVASLLEILPRGAQGSTRHACTTIRAAIAKAEREES